MLKNSAAGPNVAGWIKSFKVSLMLTFASTILHCYLGAGGAASAFRVGNPSRVDHSRWKFWNTKTSLVFVWVEQDFLPKWPTSPFMYHLYLPQITKGWSQMTLSKPAGEGGSCELLGPSNVSLWQKGDSCLWLLRFRFVLRIKKHHQFRFFQCCCSCCCLLVEASNSVWTCVDVLDKWAKTKAAL